VLTEWGRAAQLMERLELETPFCWFVGLGVGNAVWEQSDPSHCLDAGVRGLLTHRRDDIQAKVVGAEVCIVFTSM